MLDHIPATSSSPRLQRSVGVARVAMGVDEVGRTRLRDLAQQGCAKAMLPRTHSIDPEVVFLNTAGGITGGDRLSYGLDLAPGARATAATQTAERAYRAADGAGEIRVDLSVGAGGRLDWLPQETILFDGSATRRETRIALTGDASLLWVETLVFGRAAMGEALAEVALRDDRQVRRDGRLVLWEPFALGPDALDHPVCMDGARAISTVVFLAPAAETARDAVRRLAPEGVDWAASAWDGKLVVRAMAADAQPLKQALVPLLELLRDGRAMPRVWQV